MLQKLQRHILQNSKHWTRDQELKKETRSGSVRMPSFESYQQYPWTCTFEWEGHHSRSFHSQLDPTIPQPRHSSTLCLFSLIAFKHPCSFLRWQAKAWTTTTAFKAETARAPYHTSPQGQLTRHLIASSTPINLFPAIPYLVKSLDYSHLREDF